MPTPPVPGPEGARPGAFCWLDLAATDAALAQRFYAQAFGWRFEDRSVLGGHFTQALLGRQAVGTLYQLQRAQREAGVPSHWTPYLKVAQLEPALRRVAAAGGRTVVEPLAVPGQARIALIEDAVGALVGLWQDLPR